MDENQKMDKAAMLARANQAVDKVAAEFTENLSERVQGLEKALLQNNLKELVSIAYNLETEASTFGWPRVTRICKWLRKVFSGDYDHKPKAEDVLRVLSALKIMVSDPDNPNETRDEDLFRELFPIMSNAVSDV